MVKMEDRGKGEKKRSDDSSHKNMYINMDKIIKNKYLKALQNNQGERV